MLYAAGDHLVGQVTVPQTKEIPDASLDNVVYGHQLFVHTLGALTLMRWR